MRQVIKRNSIFNARRLLSILLIASSVTVYGQQKYSHIDSEEILQIMPEVKQMNTVLEGKKKQYTDQLQKMYADYQTKSEEVEKYGAAMMEAVREERLKEIQQLQASITTFQQTANTEVEKLQAKLMQPLNDKYLKIVQAVAKENGYTYIFDLATGSVAYYPETTGNITDLVKKKMGVN